MNEDKSSYKSQIPKHIGIIMDGNGRWAQARNLDRVQGHLHGINAAKVSLLEAIACRVSCVSLYVFSTENWRRPRPEVDFILDMVSSKLRKHYNFYKQHNIKIVHSGDTANLGSAVNSELKKVVTATQHYDALTLNIALNYGGRNEILYAFHNYLTEKTPDTPNLTVQSFSHYLYQPDIPDVDLIIRTGGQKRLSNFLLWQSAYAELYFTDVLWPDWNAEHFRSAVEFYQQQERKFGDIAER